MNARPAGELIGMSFGQLPSLAPARASHPAIATKLGRIQSIATILVAVAEANSSFDGRGPVLLRESRGIRRAQLFAHGQAATKLA
jgi:hypothetical protein